MCITGLFMQQSNWFGNGSDGMIKVRNHVQQLLVTRISICDNDLIR